MVYVDPDTFTPLMNVHSPQSCRGRGCPLHHPSDHFMAEWKLDWDRSRRQMFRMCTHGQNHPDPDDIAFRVYKLGQDVDKILVHACDTCCGYELDPKVWVVLGSAHSEAEAKEIAKELDLGKDEWLFDIVRASILLRK